MTVKENAADPRGLVLASGSPRRRELLAGLGLEFTVRPVDVDESPRPDESPGDYVLRLAEEKARAASRPGDLVLAADTTVVLDGEIFGKPEDEADARRMLERLQGRAHQVLTGVAIADVERSLLLAVVETTTVRFAEMTAAEIDWYVETGEPMDKAGAYAVQGAAAIFVEAVEGSYSNVVGLPLATTYRLFKRAGYVRPPLPPGERVGVRGPNPRT